jgi:hypothetical protein
MAPEPETASPEEPGQKPPEAEMSRYEVPAMVAAAMGGPLSESTSAAVEEKEASTQQLTCPNCGTPVEPGAKYCVSCAAPLTQQGREDESLEHGEGPEGLEPWAVKAGETMKKVPRGIKIGVPVAILLILAVLVTLFVLAATHSQPAAIGRYLGDLKRGDFKAAYELVSHPGGKFSSYDYFQKWQNTTSDKLGGLQGYTVEKRRDENKLFGKLISEKPSKGTPYVVTMKYKDRTFDVNMVVEEAGGSWPLNKWRIKLNEGKSRLIVSPLGSVIYVDGMLAGKADVNKDLQDALQLNHFPNDIEGAVDYAKKLVSAFQFLFSEFKTLVSNLNSVTESAQNVVNRFGTSGFSWSDIVDTANSTVQQSKGFGQEVARLALHVYWIFGGGDDGSLRARMTRVESGMDVTNLPEGFHIVEAKLPGCDADSKEFIAPEDVQITLEPTRATEDAFETTMSTYYAAVSTAAFTLNTAVLTPVVGGDLLAEQMNSVQELASKGQHVASQLTSLKYEKFKMLSGTLATVETSETWNFTTYEGAVPASTVSGQKFHMVYTLEENGGGAWKVIERKQL